MHTNSFRKYQRLFNAMLERRELAMANIELNVLVQTLKISY